MCETLYSHQIMIQHWATDNHIRSGQQITVWSKVPKQIGTNQMSRFFRIHIYGARNNRRQQQQKNTTHQCDMVDIRAWKQFNFFKSTDFQKRNQRQICQLLFENRAHMENDRPTAVSFNQISQSSFGYSSFFSAFSAVAVRLVWIGSILVWFIFLFCGIILSNCLTIILFNAQIK